MNNNMPNNFNNGMNNGFGPGAINNNPNNINQNNSFVNPVVEKAKEEMIGGQSQVGNGPNIIQGTPKINNEQGVMQGVGAVRNEPGIMQGSNIQNQNSASQNIMPGQHNSGINNYTMQKEEKPNPGVVNIPGFNNSTSNPTNTMPNNMANVNNPNFNNVPNQNVPNQNNINEVKIPNMNNIPNQNNNISNNQNNIYNQGINQQNSINEIGKSQANTFENSFNNNQVGQVPNQVQNQNNFTENKPKDPNYNQINSTNISNTTPKTEIKGIDEINNQTNFQNPNNIQKTNNIQNQQPKQNNTPTEPIISNNQNQTTEIGSTRDLNNAINGIKPTSIGSGISQVGQTELNSANQMNQGYQEPPKKKFPLSVREMVLVAIALIGIVVVIIMYWPKK